VSHTATHFIVAVSHTATHFIVAVSHTATHFIVAVSHTATHFIVAVSHTATHFISGSVINTEISACPVVILYSAKDPIFCILVKGELFKPSVRS